MGTLFGPNGAPFEGKKFFPSNKLKNTKICYTKDTSLVKPPWVDEIFVIIFFDYILLQKLHQTICLSFVYPTSPYFQNFVIQKFFFDILKLVVSRISGFSFVFFLMKKTNENSEIMGITNFKMSKKNFYMTKF